MKQDALIIFVKKPEPGKVKTRLAAAIGNEGATLIYQKLLEHTQDTTSTLSCDKFVFYADEIDEEDGWNQNYQKCRQVAADLGERMKRAFESVFEEGYKKVCIIGSDCYELTTNTITQAFLQLAGHDIVIGPARDGGYYLLGMKEGVKEVFRDIEWSTANVLAQTKQNIEKQQYSYCLLPLLTDVDIVDDLPEDLLTLVNLSSKGLSADIK